MIQIAEARGSEDLILTSMEYENIRLDKHYKFTRAEKRDILLELKLRSSMIEDCGVKLTNQGMMKMLKFMRPSPKKFKRFRMFGDFLYDMEAILNSDNTEFNLVRYLNVVCGFPIMELAYALGFSEEKQELSVVSRIADMFVSA